MIKLIARVLLILVLNCVTLVFAESTSLTPGFWVRHPPSQINVPWYLKLPENLSDPFDLLKTKNYHAARLVSQRTWLLRPKAMATHYYSDPIGPNDSLRYFVQISSWGYALEGHAVITVITVDANNKISINGSFGMWTKNNDQGALASFGPKLSQIANSIPSFRVDRNRKIVEPDQKIINEHRLPAPENLFRYRQGLTAYWGKLPHDLAFAIVQNSQTMKRTLRITLDEKAKIIALLKSRRMATPVKLHKGNIEDWYSKNWRALFVSVCGALVNMKCKDLNVNGKYRKYPQSAIEWFVELGPKPLLDSNATTTPWRKNSIDHSILRIQPLSNDKLVYQNKLGEENQRVIIDFAAGRYLLIDNRLLLIKRYMGFLKNNLANGSGTLFFGGGAPIADGGKPNKEYFVGNFKDGQLNGPGILYHYNQRPKCKGNWQRSLRQGLIACYRTDGSIKFIAQFDRGEITNGLYRKIESHSYDLQPYRVFKGKFENGKLIGKWTFVLRREVFKNGDSLVTAGAKGVYTWRNNNQLIGRYSVKRKTFIGSCELRVGIGVLKTECNGFKNPEYPWDGPGIFHAMNGGQQIVQVVNGAWNLVTVVKIRKKKRDVFSRFRREFTRWGKDVERNIREARDGLENAFCKFADDISPGPSGEQGCNINVAVNTDSDGNIWIGDINEKPSDNSSEGEGELISEASLAWLRKTELENFEINTDWFNFRPYFGMSFYNRTKPQKLIFPLFPKGHIIPPTLRGLPRKNVGGKWHFGAKRLRWKEKNPFKGKYYVYHTGADYAAFPGDTIISPANGVVDRVVKHSDGLNTVVIKTKFVTIRLLYVKEHVKKGDLVYQGQIIGQSADISVKYGGVPNHVHIAIWDRNEISFTYNMAGSLEIINGLLWP